MKNKAIPTFDTTLGAPLPPSTHAVSVSLPKWDDIIGYEEGDPKVLQSLKAGYPRFVLHPLVQDFLNNCHKHYSLSASENCRAFPSERIAGQCVDFLKKHSKHNQNQNIRVIDTKRLNVHLVVFPEEIISIAHSFWQHSGLGISSRLAETLLNNSEESIPCASQEAKLITERVARLFCTDAQDPTPVFPEDVYLCNSGISAIYLTHRALLSCKPNAKSIQFGFPYVDTLKIQEKWGNGSHFIPFDENKIEDCLAKIENLLNAEEISGVFCEIPNNPLLQTIDLPALSSLLRQYNTPLIVDDTLATFYNADVTPWADIICSSLTKFFSGTGDVLAGSLAIVNSSPFYSILKEKINAEHQDTLFAKDAVALEKNSIDFTQRIAKINSTAERLCELLNQHKLVKDVYYPKLIDHQNYNQLRKPHGGYGGLFSITFHTPEHAIAFYDKIPLCKGPSLGTNFTLLCPYTLLAHYNELDSVEKQGVSRYLLRFSAGLEDANELCEIFETTLNSII